MAKRFFCYSLKTAAFIMVLATAICGTACFWLGFTKSHEEGKVKQALYLMLMCCVLITSSVLLLYGTVKEKPNCIFLYLVLSSTSFFILMVVVLILAPIWVWTFAVLWCGQICVNSFYKEVVNTKDVVGEVIATFNGDITVIHVAD